MTAIPRIPATAEREGMGPTEGPSNKELERTRSTQTGVGPRRSIQCYAGNQEAES